ncbi:ABC transporter substrate-binding protein [Candidatus Halobonum tyrrellensis]|uniref:Extracellular solute-binding protein family 5 n=1 Tax=Candidatus Halobonum tyrrellensis G22 TaxID=1324957 RepID=V4HIP9_9EURY|nr:ABC transporter substrate-binding protein [Candidatus Halobonum tyrrellensis]ESP87789.1 extracellular solute-binding protein family 5 [Candidatus Halobonum tyrrellensis G22]
MSNEDTTRRRFLSAAGSAAAAAALAGCSGNGGDDATTEGDADTTASTGTDTATGTEAAETTELPEPETREGYLQRANLVAHEQAPWIFLNRQYSVYGKSNAIEWEARRDERIDAYDIAPAGDGGEDVLITQGQLDSGLDPHDHRETTTDNVVLQAYEGVLARDAEGSVIPMLATEYERVEDGVVEFVVRDDVTFHNGDPLTPEDVAFSINRIVQSDVGGLESPQSDQLSGVTGAEVADSEARTVRVESENLNPIVFALFASYCDIMQQSWVEEHENAYINQHMNGTGPFVLSNYEQGVSVEFERNEEYWQEPAAISTLTFEGASEASTRVNTLLSGESDIIVNVPPQDVSRVDSNESTSVAAVPSTRIIYNGLRTDVEPFDSVEFRRAMNYAVNLDSIVENVLQTFGAPTGQPTLEGFTGYNSDVDPYPHDPDRAEQLVEESGYGGAELTLHTPVGRYLKDVEIARAVASQIDELPNVSASVEQREFASLTDELLTGSIEDKPHWFLIGWGNATFDASQTLIPLMTSEGVLTTFQSERFDSLVENAQGLPGDN